MEIVFMDEQLVPVLIEHLVVEIVDFHYLLLYVVLYLLIWHAVSCAHGE